jgi:peptidoglycan hydrolase-like amidase
MCQWGALGRARAGYAYRDILSAYFPGTEISHTY